MSPWAYRDLLAYRRAGCSGPAGGAIAPGGTTGQFLKKANDLDNGTTWAAIEEDDVAGLTDDLAGKEPTVAGGTNSQYYRGDKRWQTLDKAAVGLSNVENTSDANKPISAATQTALDAKPAADCDLTAIAGLSRATTTSFSARRESGPIAPLHSSRQTSP